MGAIAAAFQSAFRDFVTDGVMASGLREPPKSDLRALGAIIEQATAVAALGGMAEVAYATRAELDADLDHDANSFGLVFADPTGANNDFYIKVGASGAGSWTLTTILHDVIAAIALTAAGSDGQVQYNDGGDLAGATGMSFSGGAISGLEIEGGTVTTDISALVVRQTYNEGTTRFGGGLLLDYSVTAAVSVDLLEAKVDGETSFKVTNDLDTGRIDLVLRRTDGSVSYAGLKLVGTSGEAALTSGTDPSTGGSAEVVRFYWEGGLDGSGIANTSVSVIRSSATNRLSIESANALVNISDINHFEFEGGLTGKIQIVGYKKATSEGKTIQFSNQGQDGDGFAPLSAASDNRNVNVFELCYTSGSDTVIAAFDAYGRLHADVGAAATPGLSFLGDEDTGLYRVSANTLGIATGGTVRWQVSSAGHLLPGADSTYDIGASGNEVRNLYVDVVVAGGVDIRDVAIATSSSTGPTIGSSHRGKVLELTAGTAVAAAFDPTLAAGMSGVIVQAGAGQATFSITGTGTLRQRSGYTKTAGQWATVSWYVRTNSDGSSAEIVLSGDMV